MNRRFVILIDSDATKEERDAVTEHFQNSESYGFWHHFPFSWLVTTEDETIRANDVRGEVQDKLGGTSIVVIQVDDKATVAYYATARESDWLKKTWMRD